MSAAMSQTLFGKLRLIYSPGKYFRSLSFADDKPDVGFVIGFHDLRPVSEGLREVYPLLGFSVLPVFEKSAHSAPNASRPRRTGRIEELLDGNRKACALDLRGLAQPQIELLVERRRKIPGAGGLSRSRFPGRRSVRAVPGRLG